MPKFRKTKRHDRFGSSIFQKDEYEIFSFGNALKSYKNDKLYFTNYVKSKENTCYKYLEKYLMLISCEDFSFLEKEFHPLDEIKYTEPAAKRLLEIINIGYKHHYKPDDLKNIFEIKHKKKNKFHFFIYNDKTVLKVLLIDFFHLGINADLIVNGNRKKMHLEDIYFKEMDNKLDIKELRKNNI